MKQRAKYVFVLALAAGSIVVSACSDDSSNSAGDGGSGGASGNKTAGSSAGGSANKAGSSHSGGDAGSPNGGDAGSTTAGASDAGGNGGAPDGGMGGSGGSDAGAGGNSGGAAGAGGAGEPALVYACGSSTLIKKQCSALAAANCVDFVGCPDCVATAISDRVAFQNDPPCDTCNAKWDAFAQCEVDAFESSNLALGVECVPDYGPDGTENCYPFFNDALECEGYVGSDVDPHACPTSWPPP